MQNSDYPQLELFSQEHDGYIPARPRSRVSSFLSYVRGYEKVILIIIAFVVTGIISFSLGVEKGKELTLNRVTKDQIYQPQPQKATVPKEAQTQTLPVQKQNILESYTIQLASYRNKTSLQKEVELLRKKGFSPLVLSRGKYIVLCVGKFSNQQGAKSLLSEFGKRYKDCFIRRL